MNSITEKNLRNFWRKVDKNKSNIFYNGERCWEWIGDSINGYGRMGIGIRHEISHRISWVIANGDIPDNLFVLHHCDNPPCVNPSHLFLGTRSDNMKDKEIKGRGNHATGDRNGSRLHPDRLARGDSNGSRLHPNKLMRGEDVGISKLTWEQVREIRRRYSFWGINGESAKTLAKEFGVSDTNIGDIVKNKIWKE
jgi:hypothetical protein